MVRAFHPLSTPFAKLLKYTKLKRELNVKSVTATKDKVTVNCENSRTELESYDFDLLISADGIGSVTRKEYFKDTNNTMGDYSRLRLPVWNELMARARTAAKLNFIGIKNRNRFGVGPQIPVKYLWRVIAKIEEVFN